QEFPFVAGLHCDLGSEDINSRGCAVIHSFPCSLLTEARQQPKDITISGGTGQVHTGAESASEFGQCVEGWAHSSTEPTFNTLGGSGTDWCAKPIPSLCHKWSGSLRASISFWMQMEVGSSTTRRPN